MARVLDDAMKVFERKHRAVAQALILIKSPTADSSKLVFWSTPAHHSCACQDACLRRGIGGRQIVQLAFYLFPRRRASRKSLYVSFRKSLLRDPIEPYSVQTLNLFPKRAAPRKSLYVVLSNRQIFESNFPPVHNLPASLKAEIRYKF